VSQGRQSKGIHVETGADDNAATKAAILEVIGPSGWTVDEFLTPLELDQLVETAKNKEYGLEQVKQEMGVKLVAEREKPITTPQERENNIENLLGNQWDSSKTVAVNVSDFFDANLNEVVAQLALRTAVMAYISGQQNVNVTIAKPVNNPAGYDHQQFRDAVTDIRSHLEQDRKSLDLFEDTTPSIFFRGSTQVQNKAAVGRGNVGGTLDTRKYQGNIFIECCRIKFNVHVDVDERTM